MDFPDVRERVGAAIPWPIRDGEGLVIQHAYKTRSISFRGNIRPSSGMRRGNQHEGGPGDEGAAVPIQACDGLRDAGWRQLPMSSRNWAGSVMTSLNCIARTSILVERRVDAIIWPSRLARTNVSAIVEQPGDAVTWRSPRTTSRRVGSDNPSSSQWRR